MFWFIILKYLSVFHSTFPQLNVIKMLTVQKLCFSLLLAIFFELPITRTFFDFPWRFELSGVNCISLSQRIFTFLWFQLHKNKRKTKLSTIKNWQQHKSITLSLHWKRKLLAQFGTVIIGNFSSESQNGISANLRH